jgi:asparagine synthase (glutamine-hydrolysing)
MCGIVGVIDYCNNTDEKLVNLMRDSITYRGPDSAGTKIFNKDYFLALAHRRLSILDLSELGTQPMSYENLTIIHNGEVYNFKQIKEELKALGYKFVSNSDTEVILKSFHKWGVKAVDKFRGMFAFAIFDQKEQKLFIFRDRAGVKPLYYYVKDDIFLFGSELKTFYAHPKFKKDINNNAIPFYFRFGYIPAPLSIFNNCYKLKPGHYLDIDCKTNSFKEICYWRVEDFYLQEKIKESKENIIQNVEDILIDSFKLRMVSDVPVGVFLSGGVDSTLVTTLLQKNLNTQINTFTIGFENKNYDEAVYAKDIAKYLNTNHTQYYCSPKDLLDFVEYLPYYYDEPFGDSSAIPTMLVSKIAKENVSVVLSGDGGDEAFIGYSKYFALVKIANLSKTKKEILKLFLNTINKNSTEFLNNLLPLNKRVKNIKDKYEKLKNALNASSNLEAFINASSYVGDDILKKLLINYEINFKNSSFNIDVIKNLSFLEQMQIIDYKTFMVDDVLTKVDRATMSVSLEGREPLLDHKIIEYVARIPNEIKYHNSDGKYILKSILYKYLPKTLIDRPKSGFAIPLESWLQNELKDLLDEFIDSNKLKKAKIYNVEYLLQLKKDLINGKNSNLSILWFVLMFEMWKQKWSIE